MTTQELREKYLKFFESKGHNIIPSASLIPHETDTSTLFTTAGMHPLVPYLLGDDHPGGKRVVNVQKCVRTGDINEVGDNRHLTFFEMMGNWSFGDYFKKEAIVWSFEFLTDKKWLGLDKNRLYVTVFEGDGNIPRDERSIFIWQDVFKRTNLKAEIAKNKNIEEDIRIIPLGVEDNFWIAGSTGPCGPDTEIFYDTRPEEGKIKGNFSDLVDSGRLIEIWNNVFMEFNKKENGTFEKLKQQNVDTGMGVERTLAVLNGKENVFETELFQLIFEKIEKLSGKKYENYKKEFRIIADHIKAATFIITEGVEPLNIGRGYVLRRLIRRAIRYGKLLGGENNFTKEIAEVVIEMYKNFYKELENNKEKIFEELEKEENKFRKTLEQGLKEFNKLPFISGADAFNLYQTYGFPLEITEELAKEKGVEVNKKEFEDEFEKHQKLSQTASAGIFKGGLADTSEETVRYHTTAHLMLAAIRKILGEDIIQKGANITAERLRFDFNYPQKLTPEQIKKIEDLVNEKIQENIPVEMTEMPKEEALKIAKTSFDASKYGDIVKVYKIGDFSIEVCGGPHVKNTGELGHFKINKEESSSAGVRRIKAILE
ncbi:MAG TPA: alanine--tRNA ligase [Candidatus Moranbacteria bacterium]|nr:alanine--tRNA ligase [Candidatus Moranbacteria bacterium]HRZ33778.1 alanine--tRNA ligase [Candidatus Moranbacteria bacterium]